MGPGEQISEQVARVRRRLARQARRRTAAAAAASGRPPIIVYALPKTAGSALSVALLDPRVGRTVHHVHVLSDAGLAEVERPDATGRVPRPEKRAAMRAARASIDDPLQRPLVITMSRHPLTRAVSWFFQGWSTDFPWMADPEVDPGARADELQARFHDRLPTAIRIGDSWFDDELAPVVGVDVFERPFDHDAAWARWQPVQADVALLRSEDLSRTFGPATAELLGTALELRPVNVAEAKTYRRHHERFVAGLRLTADEVDLVRTSRHARHFYRPAEIERGLAPHLPDAPGTPGAG